MQIIAVHLSVRNTSRSNVHVFACTTRYTDNDGIEWSAKIHSANDRERSNRFTSTWLSPGHEYDGWVFIELPNSAVSLSLKYGESCEFIITEFP